MADKKISALTSASTPVAGTEVLPIVQSSTTKQVSIANLTSGRDIAAKSLTLSGEGSYAQGKLFTTGAEGLLLQAKTGSVFDAGLLNAAGNAYAWTVAPGTQNMKLWGETTIGNSGVQNHTVYGNLVMASSGKGINFTANTPAAGMTSQLLNWYEEGTWTPYAEGSVGGTATAYTTQSGSYTRVGRLVTCCFTLYWTASTMTGNLKVGGLPFQCKTPNGDGNVVISDGTVAIANAVIGNINLNSTFIFCYTPANAAGYVFATFQYFA